MSLDHLAGIRVVDLGIITAGASTSAILADLGAEVIKVEGPGYLDPFRIWSGAGTKADWWNQSPHFAFTNRNKRSVCIDLKSPAGREILLDLVEISDVLVENFRVGALAGLGLDYANLKQRNPGLIVASISSQGTDGPLASSVSFGSTLEGSSGLSALIRSPEGAPQISGRALNYPDQVVSLFAAGAVISALVARQAGNAGAYLDISQRELTTFLLGEFFEDRTPGDPSDFDAILPSSDERWVAVSASRDAQDAILQRAAPRSLEEWARTMPADDLVRHLRENGAMAALARTAQDLLNAPSVAQSDAFAHDPAGRTAKGLPWRFGGAPLKLERPTPCLGADNRWLVVERLGRTHDEYLRLVKDGILTDAPRERGHSKGVN